MELKDRLKELRRKCGLTQEEVAENLGISAQTVSKWERGLLSPDIYLLPKIAVLFKCTIDSLFNIDLVWSVEHRREFEAKIKALREKKDFEGIYQTWMQEIKLNPDQYHNYTTVMNHVFRRRLCDKNHVEELLALADHAEKCCTDDDIRNEIYRVMLQICSRCEDAAIREKRDYYYKKLPLLLHSREVYAQHALEGEEYRAQVLKNTIYLIDMAECSIRQLIPPDAQPEEALFYYKKAADLYETVLDGQYAGHYDAALLCDYYMVVVQYVKLGQIEAAEDYFRRIESTLERHLDEVAKGHRSRLLFTTEFHNHTTAESMAKGVLMNMLRIPELDPFRERILALQKRYCEYYPDNQPITGGNL